MQFCTDLLMVELWRCSFCSLDFRTLCDHCCATLRIMIHERYFKLSCTLLALRDLTVVYHYVWDHLLNFYYKWFLHRYPNLSTFISNYGPFAMLKCLLLGFGIFWIGVTIAVKVLCKKLTFEDVWVSI